MNLLITGATGLVGRALIERVSRQQEINISAVVRRWPERAIAGVDYKVISDVTSPDGWANATANVDVVVHTAARVHVMKDRAADPLSEFRRVNVEGTLNIARHAAASGVKRFIYLSSVKVNGESTAPGRPFRESDQPDPLDAYAISKFEAESGLSEISATSALEVVTIRPVLVYGPGVQGNFLRLMRWLRRGVPLPFGSVDNRRSFVALDNLTDFIEHCFLSRKASNQCFLISDGEDLSTPDLMLRLAQSLGVKAKLFSMPVGLLRSAARVVGKGGAISRLCDSLQVDTTKARTLLGWVPAVSVDKALQDTAERFKVSELK